MKLSSFLICAKEQDALPLSVSKRSELEFFWLPIQKTARKDPRSGKITFVKIGIK